MILPTHANQKEIPETYRGISFIRHPELSDWGGLLRGEDEEGQENDRQPNGKVTCPKASRPASA